MTGCAVRMPAAAGGGAAQALPPIEWPARWTDDLEALAEVMPQAYGERLTARRRNGEEWELHEWELTLHEVVHARVHGMGVVREVRRAHGESRLPQFIRASHHANNSLAPGRTQRTVNLNFTSWSAEPDEQSVRDDSLRAYWRKPSGFASLRMPATGDVRGIVIALGPHTTTPWTLRERLPERGWAVLHLSEPRPNGESERPTFVFDDSVTIEEAAAVIAESVDQRMAEYAFAAEAALDYVQGQVAALRDAPVAVVGVSRGALVAPAIAARLGDRVDAIVLALGGTNLMRIAQSTTFENHELLTINWLKDDGSQRRLQRSEKRALRRAYLDASRLDPYHIAPHLRDRRTLVITAAIDHIVPISTGRELHQRLGRPERWHYLAGHVVAYWLLNRDPDEIIDWLEAAR